MNRNHADSCAICGTGLTDYRTLTHLPPAWIIHIDNEHDIANYQQLQAAFVQVCDDCAPQFDRHRIQSWMSDDPDALSDDVQEYCQRIEPTDLINIKENNGTDTHSRT